MTSIFMPSGKLITPDALFVRHRYERNNFDVVTPTAHVEGFYKMIIRRPDGRTKQETEWFQNLVTDAGLNQFMGGLPFMNFEGSGQFKVGTGTALPAANQTTLVSQVASSNASATGGGLTAATSAPWWSGKRWAARFNAGSFSGQALTEIGVGPDTTSCFSRALITPNGVDPGSITVLADETLDVIYELRVYPTVTDATGTITLAGSNYNFTCRPSRVNEVSGFGFAATVITNEYFNAFGSLAQTPIAWATGTLSDINGTPSGSDSATPNPGTATPSAAAYTNGSFQRQHSIAFSLNAMNTSTGNIGVLLLGMTRVGFYQYQFTPAIPKGPTKTLRLDFNTTLARRP
jgi:hypothetical protein